MFNNNAKQCKAKSKISGKRCKNVAVSGYEVCRMHGANPKNRGGHPDPTKLVGNKHAQKYGAYIADILGEDLWIFERFYNTLHSDFDLNKSTDEMAAELACMYFTKIVAALRETDQQTADTFDRMCRMQLKDLKATKSAREGEIVTLKTSPAEWAANLLSQSEEKGKKRK